MINTITNARMVQALERSIDAVTKETRALEQLQRGISGDVSRIESEFADAWNQLGETLLPQLDKPTLDQAARLLRLPAIGGDAVGKTLAETVQQNRSRLAAILADPSHQNREAKANEIAIRMAEVDEAIAAVKAGCRVLENARLFEELLGYRYGTPEYQVRFWQSLYYTHWKCADLIVEEFGKRYNATDFAAIAARYVDDKMAWNELIKTRNELVAQQKALDDQAKLVAELEDQITNAVPRTLASLRGRVVEHLAPLNENEVGPLLMAHPAADLAYRRVVGLKKKQEYLRALAEQQVKAPLADLSAMQAKLYADRTKMLRPKNRTRTWTEEEYRRRFQNDRAEKWQKRRERVNESRTHIVEYHHYDRWTPGSDILWWDLMSDGRLDGNFIDEVRTRPHHQSFASTNDSVDVDHSRDSFADVS